MTAVVRRTGSKAYFAALIVAQLSALVRYVVLARLLGPEQVGLAAIVILTAQFFDSITDAGSDRFLVQDKDGDAVGAQRLVQLSALVRGVVIALLLLIFAGPIAAFAGAPQIAPALRVLAVVPMITSLTNFNFRVAQRHHDFLPEGKVLVFAELVSLLVTVIAATILKDFTAILYGLAARALTAVVVSHAVASRGYGLGYPADIGRRLIRFGLPLILNGTLLFLASQSDRIVISRTLGIEELGRYSVLLLPIYYPSAMILRYLGSVYLPKLAGVDDGGTHSAIANRLSGTALLLGLAMLLGYSLAAPSLLPLIFGHQFYQPALPIILVGTLMCLRFLKVAPVTTALALGKTEIPLTDNLVRMLSIPFALLGVSWMGNVAGVVAGLVTAELIANATLLLLTNRAAGWAYSREMDRFMIFILVAASLVAATVAGRGTSEPLQFGAIVGIGIGLMLAIRKERSMLKEILRVSLKRTIS